MAVSPAGNNVTLRVTGMPTNASGNIALTGASASAQNGQVMLDGKNDIAIQNGLTLHNAIDDRYSKSATC